MAVTDTLHDHGVNFLGAQRRVLEDRRSSYDDQLVRFSAVSAELLDDIGTQDGGDEEGFGEGNTVAVERDRAVALVSQARRHIEEIDAALERLAMGTYGVCEDCDRPIAPPRLEALPETRQCVSCKSRSRLAQR